MKRAGDGTVLIVDDDVDVADTYASQLSGQYEVRTAYSGQAAMEALSPSVDVVLLDRQLPKLSGSDVLETIRERDLEMRVAMVTGETADFDIIEMPFDDYLTKPVTQEDLIETVTQLKRRVSYEEQVREYYSLTAKWAALKESKSRPERAENERFQSLERDIERTEARLSEIVSGFDNADFEQAFRDISRAQSPHTAD